MTKIVKNQVYVVDASVLLKPFFLEENYLKTLELVHLHRQKVITLAINHLAEFEFGNIVGRKKDEDDALESCKKLSIFQLAKMPEGYYRQEDVIGLMRRYPNQITYYDASYHVLAKSLKAKLITADNKYYQITKKEGDVLLLDEL